MERELRDLTSAVIRLQGTTTHTIMVLTLIEARVTGGR